MRKSQPTITDVNCSRGAPMGRRQSGTIEHAGRTVRVYRVPINSGGYDAGGAYWGIGKPLYCATDGEEYEQYVRAWDRGAAIHALGVADLVIRREKETD